MQRVRTSFCASNLMSGCSSMTSCIVPLLITGVLPFLLLSSLKVFLPGKCPGAGNEERHNHAVAPTEMVKSSHVPGGQPQRQRGFTIKETDCLTRTGPKRVRGANMEPTSRA